MVQLGAVLEDYPNEVIIHISDPRTGIQRRSTFPPTIAEIVTACEVYQDHLRKLKKPVRAPVQIPHHVSWRDRPAGALGQLFVPKTHPKYKTFCDKCAQLDDVFWKYGKSSDNRDGIWIPHAMFMGDGPYGGMK